MMAIPAPIPVHQKNFSCLSLNHRVSLERHTVPQCYPVGFNRLRIFTDEILPALVPAREKVSIALTFGLLPGPKIRRREPG